MKTIYIDSNFHCHANYVAESTAVETTFFDGKCKQYIEGCIFVPAGMTYVREDGEIFSGEMVTVFGDYEKMLIAQTAYQQAILEIEDMRNALNALEVYE